MLRTYNTTRAVFGQNFILTKHKHTNTCLQVRIQDFKLGEGGALKKIAPSGGRPENVWGISCEKSRFYVKKSYFFSILGGGGGGDRAWIRPWSCHIFSPRSKRSIWNWIQRTLRLTNQLLKAVLFLYLFIVYLKAV